MCRWCSQITSDYTECSFNPSRLVSAPPPPPQLLPLFSYSSLITVLVNPVHGIQGCFNTTSFDKNYWHFNFAINLFSLSFFSVASYPYIFCNTPCRKNAPLFSNDHQSRNPFLPLSSSLQFLLLFNKYANYLYRRNWNRPINPVRPCPWFYWGERQIARITTPVLWLLPLNSQHLNFQFPITSIFKFFLEVVVIQGKIAGTGPDTGYQPMSKAVHRSPNKLWRYNYIFNLCQRPTL